MEQKNNIILLVLDSVREDHCSAFGYNRETTPRLSRLAKESYKFNQAYSTGSWTVPAHGSLLTGQYPSEHGAHENNTFFHFESTNTITEVLKSEGYETACFSGNPWLSSEFGFDSEFERAEFIRSEIPFEKAGDPRDLDWSDNIYHKLYQGGNWIISGQPYKRLRNLLHIRSENTGPILDGSLLNKEIVKWLSERESSRPFFLFANYMDAHEPYSLEEPYTAFKRNTEEMDMDFGWNLNSLKDPPKNKEVLIDAYDSSLKYLDETVGNLVDQVDSLGLLEDTAIIIIGDHGQCFGEHGYWGHGTYLYDELLHIPLIVYPPSGAEDPRQIDRITSLSEVYNYVLDLSVGQFDPDQSYSELEDGSPFAYAESKGKHQNVDVGCNKYSRDGYRAIYVDNFNGVHNIETDEYSVRTVHSDELDESTRDSRLRMVEKEVLSELDESSDRRTENDIQQSTKDQLSNLGYM